MIFFQGLVFGMTLAIAVGPIALLIVDHAAQGGLRVGLGSAFGAATGDLTFALVALTMGASVLPALAAHRDRIQHGADLVLVGFGLWMIWSARRVRRPDLADASAPRRSVADAFRTIYLLTVVNPLTIVAFMAFVPQLRAGSATDAAMAALGLFAGSAVIQAGLALGGAMLQRLMSPHRVRTLNVLSAAGIIAFACVDLAR